MIDDKEIDIAARAQVLSKHFNETAYFQLRSIEDFTDGAHYNITEEEYYNICNELECKLCVGSCGWCV